MKKKCLIKWINLNSLCTDNVVSSIMYVCGLQPRMPRGVHPAEIVMTVGCRHQSGHLTVRAVEEGQRVQSVHNNSNGLGDHVYDGFVVYLHGFILGRCSGRRQTGFIFQPLPVTGDHFVSKYGAQDRLYLWHRYNDYFRLQCVWFWMIWWLMAAAGYCEAYLFTLKFGVTRQRATAMTEAVRGPVMPMWVTSSEMLGVRRNGTGRLPSSSPRSNVSIKKGTIEVQASNESASQWDPHLHELNDAVVYIGEFYDR